MHAHKYRMASWWLRREFLRYPSTTISDDIQRRADGLARANCDSAIMFGAHFRWDYLPEFARLHAYIRETVEALHARGIKFFDHHSSVLVARESHGTRTGASTFPRNHVFLDEINHDAENWSFNGTSLNSWRMVNTHTRQTHFNSNYAAEQFCMNNPDFREAYQIYVRRLVTETGIDGLMSDDAFFNSRLATCACAHCLAKFDRPLPPADDLDFWGNWHNEDFQDWIDLRYRTVAEFNAVVRGALPKNFPLMNCCSGSISSSGNENGLDAREFLRSANTLMLEMCGDTPKADGTYTQSLASQLYQLAAAKHRCAPCIGLGYSFYTPTAEFIWAFNKFLGSGTWISTLKHRLGLPEEVWQNDLPNEADIIAKAFHFEQEHPEYFSAERQVENVVYYSHHTRRYYGGYMTDYAWDFVSGVTALFNAGKDFDVDYEIPHPSESAKTLYLFSAACLSDDEIRDLEIFRLAGNRIVATGPVGVFDERGHRRAKPWLPLIDLPDIVRAPAFPENTYLDREPARCCNHEKWYNVMPRLLWHPKRMHDGGLLPDMPDAPSPFFHRAFHTADGRTVIHHLAAAFDLEHNETLEHQRRGVRMGISLITKLHPRGLGEKVDVQLPVKSGTAEVIFPLNEGKKMKVAIENGMISVPLPADAFYFITVC